jgi:hypothetical protein
MTYHIRVQSVSVSSTTSISIGEYLSASYRPDRDYIDGRVEERSGTRYLLGEMRIRCSGRTSMWVSMTMQQFRRL